MNNFDRLEVNSLKNDGKIWWDVGTQNWKRKGLSYGTLTGGGTHHFHIYPYQLDNAPHIHIYGDTNGRDLSIELESGTHHPEYFNQQKQNGKELLITTHSSTLSANDIYLYWMNPMGVNKLLDVSNLTTANNHAVLVNWFNDDAYATHCYSHL